MEEARLNITHKRPTLVLDQRSTVKNLQVGEKVQLEANIEVDGIKLVLDGDGNETTVVTFLVLKATKAKGRVI